MPCRRQGPPGRTVPIVSVHIMNIMTPFCFPSETSSVFFSSCLGLRLPLTFHQKPGANSSLSTGIRQFQSKAWSSFTHLRFSVYLLISLGLNKSFITVWAGPVWGHSFILSPGGQRGIPTSWHVLFNFQNYWGEPLLKLSLFPLKLQLNPPNPHGSGKAIVSDWF